MPNKLSESGFIIDSLPRCGSTALARMLSQHTRINCIVEPFHPRRYEGAFHRIALEQGSIQPALDVISSHWNGLKHVWEPPCQWPFERLPRLNQELLLGVKSVILLKRRNRLRRLVSSCLCRKIGYWIGSKAEYLTRLRKVRFDRMDCGVVQRSMETERIAEEDRLKFVMEKGLRFITLYYEDLFLLQATSADCFRIFNFIVSFLGYEMLGYSAFALKCLPLFDRSEYQWASAETYKLVPGIETVEETLGSDDTGWLFK